MPETPTPLDLDAIRARRSSVGYLGRDLADEIDTIIDEVERLREERDDALAVAQAFKDALADAYRPHIEQNRAYAVAIKAYEAEAERLRAEVARPVKPDREAVAWAMQCTDYGEDCYFATAEDYDDAVEPYRRYADAALDLWPGRSEAEVAEKAWDEGAKAAWESSGEGWNGEYPPDTKHDVRNPYREGGAS